MVLVGRSRGATNSQGAFARGKEMTSPAAAYIGGRVGTIALGIVVAAGLAGFGRWPAWLVLLAAVGLTLLGWWDKLLPRGEEPREPWSTKAITYFVTGIVQNLLFSALAYAAGAWIRGLLT